MASGNASSVSLGGGTSNTTRARSPEADSAGKDPSPPHPESGPYQCPRCEGLLITSEELATHMKSCGKSEREGNKRRKMEVRRRPYRANLIRAGGEPHDYGSWTRENEDAEVESASKECPHMHVKTKKR